MSTAYTIKTKKHKTRPDVKLKSYKVMAIPVLMYS